MNVLKFNDVIYKKQLSEIQSRSGTTSDGKKYDFPGYFYIGIEMLNDRGFGQGHYVRIHPDYLPKFRELEQTLKGQDRLNIELVVGNSAYGAYELWATKVEKVTITSPVK